MAVSLLVVKSVTKKTISKAPSAEDVLTEAMAIAMSRKALKDQGYNEDSLVPVQHGFPGFTELYFERDNRIGCIFWGRKGAKYWNYEVWIRKSNSEYECDIYPTLPFEKSVTRNALFTKPSADDRLTEEMAIELSRKALEDKRCDVTSLVPIEYQQEFPEGYTERIFMRDNRVGRTFWGRKGNNHEDYVVRIRKKGSEYEFEVSRRK